MECRRDKHKVKTWFRDYSLFGIRDCSLFAIRVFQTPREQAVGTDDVKVTAMNMYKYKERLRFFANVGRLALLFEQT